VFAEDVPFATLDPTLRKIKLPGNQAAILSDTVGFISDLPTNLVASFRATLEQITYADVIVHVIDVSQADHKAQKADVIEILADLGIEYESDPRIIEALNKIDKASNDDREDFNREQKFSDNKVMISALNGEGLNRLLEKVSGVLTGDRVEVTFKIPVGDGAAMSWLYGHGEVLSRKDKDNESVFKLMMDAAEIDKFQSRFNIKPAPTRKKKK
jgi:GTP-binding protein HflX